MRKGFLILIFTLLLGLLFGCQTTEVKPPPEEENNNQEEEIEPVLINYDFKYDGTLEDKAMEQFGLLDQYLRLSNKTLSENRSKMARANLWTYSAYFTTVNQIYMMNPSDENKKLLDDAQTELEWYIATNREDDHLVYASQNGNETPAFFDDNVWLVIGWLNSYKKTKDPVFLEHAEKVMDWIYTGWQEDSIGGLFWREFDPSQPLNEKVRNTCITGPAAWASAMLYQFTEKEEYKDWAVKIYDWTKLRLYDPVRYLFYDNIDGNGVINTWTFTYNQGTMISAASYLYDITKEDKYKDDVKDYLKGAEQEFHLKNRFDKLPHAEFYKDNPWFRVYLVQGFFDATKLVNLDYGLRLERVKRAVLYGYENHRDSYGFMPEDWSGRVPNEGAGGFSAIHRTLFVVGNIEIMAILDQYEAYIRGESK